MLSTPLAERIHKDKGQGRQIDFIQRQLNYRFLFFYFFTFYCGYTHSCIVIVLSHLK